MFPSWRPSCSSFLKTQKVLHALRTVEPTFLTWRDATRKLLQPPYSGLTCGSARNKYFVTDIKNTVIKAHLSGLCYRNTIRYMLTSPNLLSNLVSPPALSLHTSTKNAPAVTFTGQIVSWDTEREVVWTRIQGTRSYNVLYSIAHQFPKIYASCSLKCTW